MKIELTPELKKHLTKVFDLAQQNIDQSCGLSEILEDCEGEWDRDAFLAFQALKPFTTYADPNGLPSQPPEPPEPAYGLAEVELRKTCLHLDTNNDF